MPELCRELPWTAGSRARRSAAKHQVQGTLPTDLWGIAEFVVWESNEEGKNFTVESCQLSAIRKMFLTADS
jgi:hypothetical protein